MRGRVVPPITRPGRHLNNGDSMPTSTAALGAFQILDLTQGVGQYATRLLADLGADVIRIEPPDGGSARSALPFAGDIPGPDRSIAFLHFHTNKRSILLDIGNDEDRKTLMGLVASADAVIEDFIPGYLKGLGLGYDDLRAANPAVVLTSITPFGQTGPHAGWQGNDLIAQAMSDWMFNVGDEGDQPCAGPGDPSIHVGGTHAALGTLLALYARRATGAGQHVDVSLQEAMITSSSAMPIGRFSAATQIMRRFGSATNVAGVNCYECSDGYVVMNIHFAQLWKRLVEWIDNPILNDPYWLDIEARNESAEVADELIKEFAFTMTTEDFLSGARKRGLPVAPVNTFTEVGRSEQLAARGWFSEITHPVLGAIRMPGFPWVLNGTPARFNRTAPQLDEHRTEILRDIGQRAPFPSVEPSATSTTRLPLDGVRVIDLTRAWAGPFCTRLLADYGAEVIKIESGLFDTQREGRAGTYTELNRNKQSITVDLHNPEGQELIKRLAEQSDVLVNNYRPGTLERFNLGYESLRQINPNIVVLSMPGYGSTGPGREYASHGAQLMADSGMYYIWGHPDTPMPMRGKGAVPDFLGGAHGALVVMAALHVRDTTGIGQEVEIAQSEALAAALEIGLLESSINHRDWQPAGNRRAFAAPYDIYTCRGTEAYCAIVCADDAQWQALCSAIGRPTLASDSRFATLADRLANIGELDEIITAWTLEYTPRQVMYRLQKSGVTASAVQSGEDVYFDPHLRARDFVVPVDDPESGPMEVAGLSIHLSATPGRKAMDGRPVFAGANDYVFNTLLGLSPEERRRLEETKAIA
jgi:crotonobetainyl-CoA:carnitine CoA-transferase CaiB-like acyl-CoA transferase